MVGPLCLLTIMLHRPGQYSGCKIRVYGMTHFGNNLSLFAKVQNLGWFGVAHRGPYILGCLQISPGHCIQAYLGYYITSKLRSLPQAQSMGYHLGTAVT
jgi:hypothetical protein